jgi:hypothetical protein
MEIIVSAFSAIVAMSCLFVVINSDLKDTRKVAARDTEAGERLIPLR